MGVVFSFKKNGLIFPAWAVTESAIEYKKHIIPFSSIVNVEMFRGSNGVFNIETTDKKHTILFNNTIWDDAVKAYQYVMANSPMAIAQKEAEAAAAEEAERIRNEEIIMKCNVCGQVFCYTQKDIEENERAAAGETLSALSTLASVGTGNYFVMNEESKKLDRASAKVKDFSKCPHCNSQNIQRITQEERDAEQQSRAQTASPVSVTEELKKYKELLDMGIITQEEFDAKKKQLLGL